MEISFILLAWGIGFALTAALGVILGSATPRWLQRTPSWALGAGAGVAAVLAYSAPAHPTGYRPLDIVMRSAMAALLATALARARRRVRLVATFILAVPMVLATVDLIAGASEKWVLATAVATAGAAAASYLFPERVAWIGSVIGVGASVGALRMPVGMVSLVPSAIVAAALFFACASAWVTLRSPARRIATRAAVVVGAFAFLCGAAGVVALVNARASAERGLDDARTGLSAASSGDATAANAAFGSASSALRTASAQLDGKYARIGRALPVLSQHITVLKDLTATASTVTDTASIAAGQADLEQLRVEGGRINLTKLNELKTEIDTADQAIAQARQALGRSDSPWIVPPLRARLDRLDTQITDAETASAQVREILTVIPPIFGGNGPRRYMLVLDTPAELRGSGGVMGNFGELTAIDGAITLSRFGRTAELYGGVEPARRRVSVPADYLARYQPTFGSPTVISNLNMSPDFPTVAAAFAEQYEQAFTAPTGGPARVDGVFAIDPVALQALLSVIGPVTVDGWDDPLDGSNTAQVLLHDSYVAKGGASPERLNLLADVTLAVWRKLVAGSMPTPKAFGDALAPVARSRHLQVWMRADSEQRYMERIGLAGAVPTLSGDMLGLILNNEAESKIDYYLHRDTKVDVRFDPATSSIDTHVIMTVRNAIPATGEPPYIEGGGTIAKVGSLRYMLTVYSPLQLIRPDTTVEGDVTQVDEYTEFGLNAYDIWFSVPRGATRTVKIRLTGPSPAEPGQYRLDYFRQALVNPDPLSLTLSRTDGGTVVEHSGFAQPTGGTPPTTLPTNTVTYSGEPDATATFEARFLN